MMKQQLRTVCAGLVLAGALMVSALAADYTTCADSLRELGLFRGTAQGDALDRTPTRAEAATMLVRLLGAEEQAQALDYDAPFTDLRGWEQPYVQYLYENGLTTGTTATTFSPEDDCTAQMYAAMLLRALGYREESGELVYRDAVATATQLGLYDPAVIDPADFRRDEMVAASYTALSLSPKDTETTLLDQLVRAGAVQAAAAAPYAAQFRTYAAYRAETAGMAALDRFALHGGVQAALEGAGGSQLQVCTDEHTTIDRTAGTATAQGTLTLTAPGVEPHTRAYHRAAATLAGAEQQALLHGYAVVPVVWVRDLSRAQDRWTLTLDGLPQPYAGQLWPVEQASGAVWTTRSGTLTQTVRGGRIVAQQLTVQAAADEQSARIIVASTLAQ